MGSEINVKIKATNDGSAAFKDVDKDADALAATVSDLKGSLEGFNGASRAARDDLAKLDVGIRQNKQSLRDLATAFADANGEAEKLDIGKKMEQIQKDLSQQLKVKKIKLDELIDIDGQAGKVRLELDKVLHVDQGSADKVSRSLLSRLSDGLKSSGGTLDGAWGELGGKWGALAGSQMAPILLQVLGGALSAGAGSVGIGAALALAIKSDSGLQDAGKDLGKRLLGGLTQSAHTAMYEPIKGTFDDLTGYVDQITGQWGKAFENLAPSLRPFLDSIAGTLTDLSGVIADITGESGPALMALADGFKSIGSSLGDLLQTMTEDTEGNADALRTFLNIAAGGIDIINLLVQSYQDWTDTLGPVADLLNPIAGMYHLIGDAANAAADGSRTFKAVNLDSAGAAEEATAQLNLERSALDGLASALKAQTDPAYALIEAQKQLSEGQAAYTKAVKDHGKNSQEAKDALIGLSKASLDLEIASEKAAGTFDGQVSPALRATMKAAGLTDAQIDGVAKAFRGAKKAGDDFEDTYMAQGKATGLPAAQNAFRTAIRTAEEWAKTYYAHIAVSASYGAGMKNGGGQAHGGIVGQSASGATPSGLTWVGEHGPELASLPAGSRVWSNADSMRMNGPAGGAPNFAGRGTGGQMPFLIKLNLDGRTLADFTIRNLQDFIANQAGGDINVLTQAYR